MESIYLPEFNEKDTLLNVFADEAKHLKVLRTKINDKILVSNGLGLSAVCTVLDNKNFIYALRVDEVRTLSGENDIKIDLALALMDNKDRFEFALEKAVELGINSFLPIKSKFSSLKNINYERLKLKSVAALKQCKRSVLPEIKQLVNLDDLIKLFDDYDLVILADENGVKLENNKTAKSVLLVVGAEGGFDDDEINRIKSCHNVQLLKLGVRRLRAETAVISALSVINYSFIYNI